MKYADPVKVVTFIFTKFAAQSKMNVIQCFTGVKFRGQINHFNFKEQQKILEAICRYYITICNLESTGSLFLTRITYL